MKLRYVFLYSAVVSIAVVSSKIAWAQSPITGCTTITEPGPYMLKNDIIATDDELQPIFLGAHRGCIIIATNFVTVNLSDYLITGPGGFRSVGIAQDTKTPSATSYNPVRFLVSGMALLSRERLTPSRT